MAKDLGNVCGLNQHLDATATMCLVNRRGTTRRLAELVDTRSLKVKNVRHEEGGYERELGRLDDETTARTKDRPAYENHGL